MAKIKIDGSLYERIKRKTQISGYSSPEEFITHLIEKELEKIESSDNDQIIMERLRGLGYID